MASYRHLARIAVMQTIFTYEFRGGEAKEILAYNLKEYADRLKDVSFAQDLVKNVLDKKKDILDVLQEEAPEWPVDKIAPVDRAILEIGIYEIIFSDDVPPIVAINEAVEVAKSYGDVNAPKFVNGVLSTVMHKYRPEAVQKTAESQANGQSTKVESVSKKVQSPSKKPKKTQ